MGKSLCSFYIIFLNRDPKTALNHSYSWLYALFWFKVHWKWTQFVNYIDLHKNYLLIGIFLFKLGKNVGICHWDRGLIMAHETPEKNPCYGASMNAFWQVVIKIWTFKICIPLIIYYITLFGISWMMSLNFQQLVSELTWLHTLTYYPFSGASWTPKYLVSGAQPKVKEHLAYGPLLVISLLQKLLSTYCVSWHFFNISIWIDKIKKKTAEKNSKPHFSWVRLTLQFFLHILLLVTDHNPSWSKRSAEGEERPLKIFCSNTCYQLHYRMQFNSRLRTHKDMSKEEWTIKTTHSKYE